MKRMRSTVLTISVLLACFIGLCGCGKSEPEVVKLKICTLENEEHAQGIVLRTFKEEVEKLSGGKIQVDPFYNGSLYTAEGGLQALVSGELEMNLVSTQQTADYMPSISMFGSPYFFKDYNHMRAFADSELGTELAEQVKRDAGYYVVGYFYNGSRELNLKTEIPVTKPEDLSDTILRMPNTAAWVAVGESLGAKVSTLAYSEVYSGLQLGTIDAQDNPLPSDKAMKFYEVSKQISLTDHIIDLVLIGINGKVWDSLSDEYQNWILTAMHTAALAGDNASLTLESELIDFFEEQGLVITYPDKEAFAEYSHNYYVNNGLTESWDMELYDQVQALAK